MSGLVGYGSSDEDEAPGKIKHIGSEATIGAGHPQLDSSPSANTIVEGPPNPNADQSRNGAAPSQGALFGPHGPPQVMPENGMISAPQSPYSASRAQIRDMTLPTVPNLNIPPSPPGSPPPGMDAKIKYFLELKKQGIHFNEKLARSSALKNPSLLRKLMVSAGVDECDQYDTTLPKNIWDPTGFPAWAYKEELAKSQQDMTKKKEEVRARVQRESIDFISATNSGNSSRGGTPGSGMGQKGLKGSAAERVMAGLDREKTRSPQVSTMRSDLERRGGRTEGSQHKANSRSPKRRKRSRSR